MWRVGPPAPGLFLRLPQRQKSAYAAATYTKAEPAPVTSSAPPAGSLYSSPVVSALPGWATFLWEGVGGLPQKEWCLIRPVKVRVQPGPPQPSAPGQGSPAGEEHPGKAGDLSE